MPHLEEVDPPKDVEVLVVIPESDDEKVLRSQLQGAAESVLAEFWNNEEDEVWSEYLLVP